MSASARAGALTTPKNAAVVSVAMVALSACALLALLAQVGWKYGCGGSTFVSLFAPDSPARWTLFYLLATFAFGTGGAAFLAARSAVSRTARWILWGLAVALAIASSRLFSSMLAIWWLPLWMLLRYAMSSADGAPAREVR